jgi:hypothetical protein
MSTTEDRLEIERPAGAPRLRRITQALGSRDWLAIGIELIVVTLGVLLAFQIDQWGERRSKAAEERRFLERLYRENGKAIDELRDVIPIHQKALREIGIAVRSRNKPEDLAKFSTIDSFGCQAAMQPSAGYNETAFEELIASGRLNLVSDPALRSLIRDLVAVQAMGSAQLAYSRQQVALMLPALNPYYRLEVAPRDEQDSQCYIDWPRLVGDQQAVNAAVRAYRVHQLMLSVRTDMQELNERVEAKLACVLKKPNCAKN